MIVRRIDAEDRRRILIEVTELGKEQAHKQYQMIMSMVMNMLKYLGEEDSLEFIRIMKKLSSMEPDEFV